MNFVKLLRTSFDRTPPDDSFLCLSANFEKFFTTPLLTLLAPLGNCLFHGQVAEFQPANTIENYLTGDFQAFYTRTRGSHSKALICLKSLKIICEEVNL